MHLASTKFMKKISLTGKYGKDKYTIVDNDDYEKLANYKWYLTPKGYCWRHENKNEYIGRNRKNIIIHRQILKLKKGEVADHINRNPLDNRKSNLRKCTTQQNIFNRRKLKCKKLNASKYKGVFLRPYSRWESNLKFNGKSIYLGSFNTEIQAAKAYNLKARELFGSFALLNKV